MGGSDGTKGSTEGAVLLREAGVKQVQEALRERDLDGWLLYEFHGQNPIASSLVGLGWATRRSFVLVPAEGEPVALIHAIEHSSWTHWPWAKESYKGWRDMEDRVRALVEDRPRLALETSERNAVPTLDLVPAGILQLLRGFGVDPVSSGDLVSLFHSVWSQEQLEGHRKAARIVQEVAREAFERAADAVRMGAPLTEGGLSRWIVEALTERGLTDQQGCIAAIGPRAADPHYQPGEVGEVLGAGEVVLIDLWGGPGSGSVPADQTWMGYLGADLPPRVQEIWEAVRDARDAGVRFLEDRFAAGAAVRGFEVDDVCRGVIDERGYGDSFVHRTGHSIDRGLHGSGPNLDNLETRDDRSLVPGVGFSIEPGIYLPDDLGVRTEVDVYWAADGPEVTTPDPQEEVFLFPVE